MANLYLTEQGSVLRKTGNRIIVEKDDQVLLDVPCNKIDAVLIFGNVQFTTQAVHELFEQGIEMAILTRSGRLIGQLTSPFTKNIELRILQFQKYFDMSCRLGISRTIVQGKITNGLNLVRTFSYNHSEIPLHDVMDMLRTRLEEAGKAEGIETLMGIEGAAARSYFSAFGKMILGEYVFDGRVKHPPPDPVNALLSFGYTLVFNEIMSLLDGLGFDPYLGYFHEVRYGRASLASDLIEEFRASVDRFTLFLINNRVISRDDFYENPKGGVYLNRAPLMKYLAQYEQNVTREFTDPETGTASSLRKSFRSQAEKLASCVKTGSDYHPFKLEV